MSRPASKEKRAGKTVLALACLLLFLAAVALFPTTQSAHAAGISISSNGTSATIAPSTSIRYESDENYSPAWNHGCFYVYFFQGTTSTSSTLKTAGGSSVPTLQTNVNFQDGVAWAKVHVAAVSSSTAANGGKNARLKDGNGNNINWFDWCKSSQRFYVWISDTGGNAGTITLSGVRKKQTIYADGKTFSNVYCLELSSQPASDRMTQGATISANKDVINIPFEWSGKQASQVASAVSADKGIGSNSNYITYYRMNWMQYVDGISYAGYSPYKLQHGVSNPGSLYTSINLSAVGIFGAPTYTDNTLKTKNSGVYRNYNTSIMCFLKKPKIKVKLDTNGGTLVRDLEYFLSDSIPLQSAECGDEVQLPQSGYLRGRDKSKNGYELAGYCWKSGTNRGSFSVKSLTNSSSEFKAFDQTTPETPSLENPVITTCNSWAMPSFGPSNASNGTTLVDPTASTVTYKAIWKARTFTIHYVTNGEELDSDEVPYDSRYKLKDPPSGCTAWTVKLQDGTTSSETSGYMPAQDIYCYASVEGTSTVRYHINGKLVDNYVITWDKKYGTASGPKASIAGKNLDYEHGSDNWSADMLRKYNDDAQWTTLRAKLSASYTQYADIGAACTHTKTAYYCSQCNSASWSEHTHQLVAAYLCSKCGRVVGEICNHSVLSCLNTSSNHTHVGSCYTSVNYADNPIYRDRNFCEEKTGYEHYQGDILTPGQDAYYGVVQANAAIDQSAVSYSPGPGKSDIDNLVAHNAQISAWFTDSDCTTKAAGSYKIIPGETLDFYAYTTHYVVWEINGELAKIEPCKYDSVLDPYKYGDDINTYGGTLKSWFTDYACSNEAGNAYKIDGGTLYFYGYTEHKVHYWMDAALDAADLGKAADSSDEDLYCLYEESVRYGETPQIQTSKTASSMLTREGCEDWGANNGKWFASSACEQEIPLNTAVTEDCVYYSYNVVKLAYDLTLAAKRFDKAEGGSCSLFTTSSLSNPTTLRSFLPTAKLLRCGTTASIKGDGTVYWKSDAGTPQIATSTAGGYLSKDASGTAIKSIKLLRSTTVYKNWAQGLYDGIITN